MLKTGSETTSESSFLIKIQIMRFVCNYPDKC